MNNQGKEGIQLSRRLLVPDDDSPVDSLLYLSTFGELVLINECNRCVLLRVGESPSDLSHSK